MNYSFFIFFFFLPDLIKELCTEESFEKKKNTFICKISKYISEKIHVLAEFSSMNNEKKPHFFCPQNICSRILASFKSNKNTCILWYLWLLKLFCQLLRIHHFCSCYVYSCGLYTRREITLKIKYYQIDNQYLVLCPLWEIVLPQCLWPWR